MQTKKITQRIHKRCSYFKLLIHLLCMFANLKHIKSYCRKIDIFVPKLGDVSKILRVFHGLMGL